jgi:hypothetical protein
MPPYLPEGSHIAASYIPCKGAKFFSHFAARQGSISSLETQNVSYARLLATTQKSLEERNVAYAALAPKNRELTQRCTEHQKALEDARAECAQLQAQLTEAVNTKEQAKSALKNKEEEADELSKQLTMAEEAGEGGLAAGWSTAGVLPIHSVHSGQASLTRLCRLRCAFTAAGRIASGVGEMDGSNSGNGDSGNAHDAGLEARLEALQEALATKVAELARVSSERTALQLRCDKQEKAAREQELCVIGTTRLLPSLLACFHGAIAPGCAALGAWAIDDAQHTATVQARRIVKIVGTRAWLKPSAELRGRWQRRGGGR